MMQYLFYAMLFIAPSLVWAAEKPPKTAPTSGMAEPLGATQLFQVALVLVLILLLIVTLAWLMRRFGNLPASGNSAIRTLAGVSLGQRERVVLIEVGKTQLLLGVAPGRVQTLHVLDQPVELPEAGSGERFAERLATALKRRGAA
jgi:flagellar protein FliO/FliZ